MLDMETELGLEHDVPPYDGFHPYVDRTLGWTACQSTRLLDPHHREHFALQAQTLLDELQSHRLTVVLVPSNPNHKSHTWARKLREAVDTNVDWYRSLYAEHPYLKRTRLVQSFGHIIEGTDRSHHSPNRWSTHECVARSLVLGSLMLGHAPDPRDNSDGMMWTPADCIRTGVVGIGPANPADLCHGVIDLLRTTPDIREILKAPAICGVSSKASPF